ncbi:MAG: glycosyltransferase [Pseudomonadota bacterium]
MTQTLAIVTPYYNSPTTIEPLCTAIAQALEGQDLDWRLVFVDDRSPCDGWSRIRELGKTNQNVRGVRMSHNVGQNLAIKAGLHAADADLYVVMDCDLQDNPQDIPRLLRSIRDGSADIVLARRSKSRDVRVTRWFLREGFYRILRFLTGADLGAEHGTFCAFRRSATTYLRQINSRFQVFALNIRVIGFDVVEVPVDRRPRSEGESSYSFWDLVRLAIYILIRYSDRLVRFFMIFGGAVFVLSMLALAFYGILGLMGAFGVSGFATIVLMLVGYGGFQTLVTSLVGIYCARILNETRADPLYFIEHDTDQST